MTKTPTIKYGDQNIMVTTLVVKTNWSAHLLYDVQDVRIEKPNTLSNDIAAGMLITWSTVLLFVFSSNMPFFVFFIAAIVVGVQGRRQASQLRMCANGTDHVLLASNKLRYLRRVKDEITRAQRSVAHDPYQSA